MLVKLTNKNPLPSGTYTFIGRVEMRDGELFIQDPKQDCPWGYRYPKCLDVLNLEILRS